MNKIMKKTFFIILVVAIAIVVGGGAFYGGIKYSQSKTPQNFRNQMVAVGTRAGAGIRGDRTGANFTLGEIISKDNESITIKLQDGSSKIIFFSNSTEITKSAEGSLNDLEIGKTISINGTNNQDGSITANSIQLR